MTESSTKDTKEKELQPGEQTARHPGSKSGALVGVNPEELARKASAQLFTMRRVVKDTKKIRSELKR
jgi:hypothetical protein